MGLLFSRTCDDYKITPLEKGLNKQKNMEEIEFYLYRLYDRKIGRIVFEKMSIVFGVIR